MQFIKRNLRKIKRMSIPVRASMAFMLVNFLQKGISFLTAPIFTRLLTTDEYGKISVYSSWVDVIGIFAMFGLCTNVYYKGILEFKEDEDGFTFSLLVLSNLITSVVLIVVWNINNYIVPFLNVGSNLILFMFICFFLEPAFEFWKVRQRFGYKYRLMSLYSILIMVFSPVFAIAGIFLLPELKVEARIIGAQIISLCICIGCYIYEIIKAKCKVHIKYWKYAISYNLPLLPYFLSTYVLSSSDRLMIAYFCGEDKAGIYGIAYTMSSVVTIVWNAINATLIPTIYKWCDEGRRNSLNNVVIPVIFGYGSICLMIMLLAPEIIAFLAPSSYGEGMYIVPVVVGGVFFMSIFAVFSHIVYYEKKAKYIAGAGIGAAILNLILNFICIPIFGYMAAGYTTLIAYLFEVMWAFAAMKKVTGETVYDMKKIGLISFIVLLMSAFVCVLYDALWIRSIIFTVMIYVLWRNRRKILGGLQSDKFGNKN